MTDFLSWWADHWPLIPVLVLYPIYAWWVVYLVEDVRSWLKRRREP